MADLEEGLYEALLTQCVAVAIEERLADGLGATTVKIDSAEAGDRLGMHIGAVLRRSLESLPDKERAQIGVELVNEIVQAVVDRLGSVERFNKLSLVDERLVSDQQLRSVTRRQPDGSLAGIPSPLTPLLDTVLLTDAPGEPRIGAQIEKEIASANRIDVLMAFIRMSGIRMYLDPLRAHCEKGGSLRVITTTYTNSTECRALEALVKIGAEVKVSYDTSASRLHAKAWHFHRHSGASTAFIGSSNLTYSALHTGLEWNVRVSGLRNPDVLRKVESVFEAYWESGDFEAFVRETFIERANTKQATAASLSPLEFRLYPFQERLLEQIEVARIRGKHANLLVAATGTGKTVMAAADYASLRKKLPRSRLLFVAHREEILRKSLQTFRHVVGQADFGELWVGAKRPQRFSHVFASVQTLARQNLADIASDHFDVVIVDEFHHAAARSYERLLEHLRPVELLGLTATPERADGLSVLSYFDDEIAAELRLWDAIDQRRLAPFIYFGVHDQTDLSRLPWKRGRGYEVEALENLYTGSDIWVRGVINAMLDKVDDIENMKCLGFCVSVKHAHFMARHFNDQGIPAVAVSAETPAEARHRALQDLAEGRLRVVFSVDLFSEGVDVPSVDTLLFLRPTESGTLFLQQLGRGLRLERNKAHCTVLDFVGQHRKEFRFDLKLRALLGGTRKDLTESIEQGFPYLPSGCHMELDRVAQEIVLSSLKNAIPSGWRDRVAELKAMMATGAHPPSGPTLQQYLDTTGLELADIYRGDRGWSDLLEAAGCRLAEAGPEEKTLRKAIGRMLHIDDFLRIRAFRIWSREAGPPSLELMSEVQLRRFRMLLVSLLGSVKGGAELLQSFQEPADNVWAHPQVLAELAQLMDVLEARVTHAGTLDTLNGVVPISQHARYTRLENLAAFSPAGPGLSLSWREGVRWFAEDRADVFVFTAQKSEARFSPTTMYRDYAISRDILHWESQSLTSDTSTTGQRYQHHEARGSTVHIFARKTSAKDDRAFWYLGQARYISHEGSRPMAVKWRLAHRLPIDLYEIFAAQVA